MRQRQVLWVAIVAASALAIISIARIDIVSAQQGGEAGIGGVGGAGGPGGGGGGGGFQRREWRWCTFRVWRLCLCAAAGKSLPICCVRSETCEEV